jgi:hypothetical protein
LEKVLFFLGEFRRGLRRWLRLRVVFDHLFANVLREDSDGLVQGIIGSTLLA